MDEKEISLLEKLAVNEITEHDFLRTYPVDLTKNKSYLIDLSEEASKQKDEDTLSLLLDVIAVSYTHLRAHETQ